MKMNRYDYIQVLAAADVTPWVDPEWATRQRQNPPERRFLPEDHQ